MAQIDRTSTPRPTLGYIKPAGATQSPDIGFPKPVMEPAKTTSTAAPSTRLKRSHSDMVEADENGGRLTNPDSPPTPSQNSGGSTSTPLTPAPSSFSPESTPSAPKTPSSKPNVTSPNALPTPNQSPRRRRTQVTIEREYFCHCGKPADKYLCQSGKPKNIGKHYYICANRNNKEKRGCRYWQWVVSSEVARDRERAYRTRVHDENNVPRRVRSCRCGELTKVLESKHGMAHNYGRKFVVCPLGKCGYWMLADGSAPFSDQSQALFNDWMDGGLF
jgi:hypothetical protein